MGGTIPWGWGGGDQERATRTHIYTWTWTYAHWKAHLALDSPAGAVASAASQLSLRSWKTKKALLRLVVESNELKINCQNILKYIGPYWTWRQKSWSIFVEKDIWKIWRCWRKICVRQSNVYGKVCVSPIFFSRFGGPKRGYFKHSIFLSFWTSWFSVLPGWCFFVFSRGTGGFFHLTNRLTSKF